MADKPVSNYAARAVAAKHAMRKLSKADPNCPICKGTGRDPNPSPTHYIAEMPDACECVIARMLASFSKTVVGAVPRREATDYRASWEETLSDTEDEWRHTLVHENNEAERKRDEAVRKARVEAELAGLLMALDPKVPQSSLRQRACSLQFGLERLERDQPAASETKGASDASSQGRTTSQNQELPDARVSEPSLRAASRVRAHGVEVSASNPAQGDGAMPGVQSVKLQHAKCEECGGLNGKHHLISDDSGRGVPCSRAQLAHEVKPSPTTEAPETGLSETMRLISFKDGTHVESTRDDATTWVRSDVVEKRVAEAELRMFTSARKILVATDEKNIVDAARRVVAERDLAIARVRELESQRNELLATKEEHQKRAESAERERDEARRLLQNCEAAIERAGKALRGEP